MLATGVIIVCLVSGLSAYQTKGGSGGGSGRRIELPLVQTAQGLLRGSILTTYTGTRFYSFRGVRFAEPPTGENRFKPPVPVKPWQGERNATEDGSICPQPWGERLGQVSEDCLFLSVYTKKFTGKKPVIVFFHPGGWLVWTGNSEWFGPQYIMNRDVVFVTANYRLGALGLLSTGDALLRGNYAMKDQVQTLRWIKQNIAKFGGDPDNVTIMGYSAGSSSVQMHMLSPMSRGLFHRAISMSGSATAGWSINRNPMYLAQELAKRLGCDEAKTSQQVFDCVKDADGQLMANHSNEISLWEGPPLVLYAPVVEKDYGDGEERFLTEEPIELIKRGEIYSVPLIVSMTSDEMAHIPYYILENDTLTKDLNDNFNRIAPRIFSYEREGPHSLRVTEEFKKLYLNNQPVSNATREGLGQLYTDSIIIFPQVEVAKLFAEKPSQPVYMYLFSYVGRYSFRYIPGTNTPIGAAHHDDLIYITYISRRFPEFNDTDPEVQLVYTLTSTLAEFAKTGIPTLPELNKKWNPLTPQNPQYLEISHDKESCQPGAVSLKMIPGVPFPQRMAVWESLFPASGPHHQIMY